MKAPSADIKDFLSYGPDTGVFKWVKRSGPRGERITTQGFL
ncbi:hypothetical protein N271_gp40 [Salmonella phage Jersey]|uniref:Uncharacterized protein n=1 Tax=Salmonella phage Jersey TaxID=1340534 RepID=S4WXY9_9CAUD|nr:hypothetical protein N271_gp40 [Salmonella phage Jersey]AGP24928.1 hypothetical protein Jersey_40 [Salmonella phage Jersey]